MKNKVCFICYLLWKITFLVFLGVSHLLTAAGLLELTRDDRGINNNREMLLQKDNTRKVVIK